MAFLLRFGAVSGVLCALLLALPAAVEAFTGETTATSLLLALSPALAPPLLTAVHLSQAGAAGRFGSVAYAVNLLGIGLFGGAAFALNTVLFFLDGPVVTDLLAGPTRFALLVSLVVFVVGTVLFAVAMFRGGVVPRAAAVGYGLALPVFAGLARFPDTPLTSALHVAVGAVLVWLSVTVWRRIQA
jgi:hypothetical protein